MGTREVGDIVEFLGKVLGGCVFVGMTGEWIFSFIV